MKINVKGFVGRTKVLDTQYSDSTLNLLPGFIREWNKTGARLEIEVIPQPGDIFSQSNNHLTGTQPKAR